MMIHHQRTFQAHISMRSSYVRRTGINNFLRTGSIYTSPESVLKALPVTFPIDMHQIAIKERRHKLDLIRIGGGHHVGKIHDI